MARSASTASRHRLPNRITAALTDGRVVTRQVDVVPGQSDMKMQRSDFERKFADNVRKVWSSGEQRRVLDAIWTIDQQDKLDHLLGLLVVPG